MEDHIRKHREQIQGNIYGSYNNTSSLQKSEETYLEKSEGSRGGKVIGHTKSGKAIYDTHNHFSHAKFTSEDHEDAEVHHGKEMKKYGQHSEKGRAARKHHQEQSNEHRDSSQALPGSAQLSKFDKEKDTLDEARDSYLASSGQAGQIKKSEENTLLEGIPSPGLYERNRIANNIQKSFIDDHTTPISDILEKGGARAQVGEVRMWGSEKWVKHQDGWVNVSKTGKATLERPGGKREAASDDHVSHHNTHIERHRRESDSVNRKDEIKDVTTLSDEGLNSEHADMVIIANKKMITPAGQKYLEDLVKEKQKREGNVHDKGKQDSKLNYNSMSLKELEGERQAILQDTTISYEKRGDIVKEINKFINKFEEDKGKDTKSIFESSEGSFTNNENEKLDYRVYKDGGVKITGSNLSKEFKTAQEATDYVNKVGFNKPDHIEEGKEGSFNGDQEHTKRVQEKKREDFDKKQDPKAHEKRGFDESKGDVDVTGKGSMIPKEKNNIEEGRSLLIQAKKAAIDRILKEVEDYQTKYKRGANKKNVTEFIETLDSVKDLDDSQAQDFFGWYDN